METIVFEQFRSRWEDLILGPNTAQNASSESVEVLDTQILRELKRLDASPPLEFSGAIMWDFAKTLRLLATAIRTVGSSSFESPTQIERVTQGLQELISAGYNSTMTAVGNWWEWTIGIPQAVSDTMLILRGQIPETLTVQLAEAIVHNIPDPYVNRWSTYAANRLMTSANLIDQVQPLFVLAIIHDDGRRLDELVRIVRTQMIFTTSGEGLYADGSYIFHKNIPYNGTYGSVFFRGLLRFIYVTNGTTHDFSERDYDFMTTFASKSLFPLIVGNEFSSIVCGRAADRPTRSSDTILVFIELLIFANYIIPDTQVSNAFNPVLFDKIASLDRTPNRSEQKTSSTMVSSWLQNLESIAMKTRPNGSSLHGTTHSQLSWYDRMLRGIYRSSNGWTAEIALADSQTAFFEHGANENTLGYHAGNGAVWVNSAIENPKRAFQNLLPSHVPGTTIDRSIDYTSGKAWSNLAPANRWAGAICDGQGTAAVTYEMHGYQSDLLSRKAWLLTPSSVLCIGALIGVQPDVSRTIFYATVDRDYRPVQRENAHTLIVSGWGRVKSLGQPLSLHEDVIEISDEQFFRTSIFIDHNKNFRDYTVLLSPFDKNSSLDSQVPNSATEIDFRSTPETHLGLVVDSANVILIAYVAGTYSIGGYLITIDRASILFLSKNNRTIKLIASDPADFICDLNIEINDTKNNDSHKIQILNLGRSSVTTIVNL